MATNSCIIVLPYFISSADRASGERETVPDDINYVDPMIQSEQGIDSMCQLGQLYSVRAINMRCN